MIIIMITVLMVIMMITVLMVIIDIMAIIPIMMMMMMTGKQSNKQLRFTERGEEPGGAQE